MDHSHPDNIHIGPRGERTTEPMKVVDADETLHGLYSGGTCIHQATYTVATRAVTNGSMRVSEGGSFVVHGTHNGSLHVDDGAIVDIFGSHNGSTHVSPGGLVRVHPAAKLAGSLHVGGLIENRGARGGTVTTYGNGEVRDMDGSIVKQPEISGSGARVYKW
ncbi:hypothetical protein [Microbacterium testaceum]|uniref:hypothetical protein n=1 Tax=Microbacterium testaceum TaxID=2033 RepID=UPI000AB572E2|nr:hypothetical protein [Microbacterium testaceum]